MNRRLGGPHIWPTSYHHFTMIPVSSLLWKIIKNSPDEYEDLIEDDQKAPKTLSHHSR